MKKILYTANIGSYDILQDFDVFNKDWEYYLFTDNKEFKSDFWNVKYVDKKFDNIRTARHIKLFPEAYLPKHDISIWIDSNLVQDCNLDTLVEQFLTESFAIRNHLHSCIYKEADACLSMGKGDIEEIRRQMKDYIGLGYPSSNGQVETGIIIRKSGDKVVKRFCENWWKEIVKHSSRDQLSFMKVLWESPIPISYMPFETLEKHFKMEHHND